MKKLIYFLSFSAVCLLVQCRSSRLPAPVTTGGHLQAAIVQEGFINCFEKGLSASGQPLWCEASAILYDGNRIFLANDKDMPDARSSVFSWPFINGFADTTRDAEYLNNPIFKSGRKFEDFALTPGGNTVFLSTAFDRVKPESSEWNAYNTIFYWQAGHENTPLVLGTGQADSTSVSLRVMISAALADSAFPQGKPYFKIEGLAATRDRLYFGIREEGKKFDDFTYKVKILSATYRMRDGRAIVGDRVSVTADIRVDSINPYLKQPLGLSSIEYDHYNKRFLIVTSYEKGDQLGAYLWSASARDLSRNRMTLVRDTQGNPLAFSHKAEDIAIISKNKIIVINDDDRVLTRVGDQVRQPNQAAYSIVEFK